LTIAQFTNLEQETALLASSIGDIAFFNRATFAGRANFRGAEIADQFILDDAQFTSSELEADFDSITVGDVVYFNRVTFAGPVNFGGAQIAGFLDLDDAQLWMKTAM
jgi:hypothetical protein